MQRLYHFIQYICLGFISGIITSFAGSVFVRTIMFFVFLSSLFFILMTIIYPGDSDIRQRKINMYLGRE